MGVLCGRRDMRTDDDACWPALPYEAWKDTYATLHLWSQVVGKIALALAAPLNHCWGVALRVTPRGLTTRPLPHGTRTFTIQFDFIDHQLRVLTSDGEARGQALGPRSVAGFHRELLETLDEMGLAVKIRPTSTELPEPIRLDRDTEHHSYDREYVDRPRRIPGLVGRLFPASPCAVAGPRHGAPQLRPRIRRPPAPHPGAGGSRVHRFAVRVRRQVQPGEFLLGQFRLGGDAVFRSARTAAGGCRVRARCVFARGDQPWLLAGQRTGAGTGVLCVCGAGTGWIEGSAGAAGGCVLPPRTQRIRPALRSGAAGRITGRAGPRLHRQHLRARRGSRALGSQGAG